MYNRRKTPKAPYHVERRAAVGVGHGVRLKHAGKAKVGQLQNGQAGSSSGGARALGLVREQDVLWLEVAMHGALVFQIEEGEGELLGKVSNNLLRQRRLLPQVAVEIAGIAVLHDNVDGRVRLVVGQHAHNIGVVQASHGLNLAPEKLPHLLASQPIARDALDGHNAALGLEGENQNEGGGRRWGRMSARGGG